MPRRVPSNKKKSDIPVTFRAMPDEVENWKQQAEADDRSLSSWLRLRIRETQEKVSSHN